MFLRHKLPSDVSRMNAEWVRGEYRKVRYIAHEITCNSFQSLASMKLGHKCPLGLPLKSGTRAQIQGLGFRKHRFRVIFDVFVGEKPQKYGDSKRLLQTVSENKQKISVD